jgi:hypothetical protein
MDRALGLCTPLTTAFERRCGQGTLTLRSTGSYNSSLVPHIPFVGAWRSLVARSVRDAEVGGSNPLAPTISFFDRLSGRRQTVD